MIRITGNTWHIADRSEFLNRCAFGADILAYAEKREAEDGCLWFFRDCYADWERKQFLVSFGSYETIEYKDHLLALSAKPNSEGVYQFSVMRKSP